MVACWELVTITDHGPQADRRATTMFPMWRFDLPTVALADEPRTIPWHLDLPGRRQSVAVPATRGTVAADYGGKLASSDRYRERSCGGSTRRRGQAAALHSGDNGPNWFRKVRSAVIGPRVDRFPNVTTNPL